MIRQGEAIRTFTSKTRLDRARTEDLIENAFARKLKSEWWDGLDIHQVYMSEKYRAGAILTKIDDFIYLDKFAVTEEARGETSRAPSGASSPSRTRSSGGARAR